MPVDSGDSEEFAASLRFRLCFAAPTATTANVPATVPTALKMEAPSFLRRPLAVRGIPIFRDIRDLNAEIPSNRRHENPPQFMSLTPLASTVFSACPLGNLVLNDALIFGVDGHLLEDFAVDAVTEGKKDPNHNKSRNKRGNRVRTLHIRLLKKRGFYHAHFEQRLPSGVGFLHEAQIHVANTGLGLPERISEGRLDAECFPRTRRGIRSSETPCGLSCEFERKYYLVVLRCYYGMLPQSLPESSGRLERIGDVAARRCLPRTFTCFF